MDIETLRRKALAARRLTVEVAGAPGVRFDLLLPTRHESSVLYARASFHDGERDQAAMLRWLRALLVASVESWVGVQQLHVMAGADAEDLPLDAAALELVLDAQPQWEEQLTVALQDALVARRGAEDIAAKTLALIEWERAQADAKKLDEAGYGGMAAAAPELEELAAQARHCWHFCAGWVPERWPLYEALYPVEDWPALIYLMQEIRRAL